MADESTVGNDNAQAQCEGLMRLEGALGEDHPWVRLSRHVLHVDKLREIQVEALKKITKRGECGRKLLFVGCTGVGKTHFFRMLGCILGGVIVIIVPLLSLSADQVEKMNNACQEYGSVEAHHLDELGEEAIDAEIIPRIEEIDAELMARICNSNVLNDDYSVIVMN